jgi:hypothetical protein
MEDAHGTYNQEDDIRGMDVHLGIEGTNSNGHGEGRDENMNMVETIKNLQKDVQRHKDDNERIMRAKEQQEDLKMKLMQSLNKIENKLDKESGSRKSGRHGYPDEKRRARSVSRHHHHSRGIPIRENTPTQFHPLSGSLRGLGWMIYKEK